MRLAIYLIGVEFEQYPMRPVVAVTQASHLRASIARMFQNSTRARFWRAR